LVRATKTKSGNNQTDKSVALIPIKKLQIRKKFVLSGDSRGLKG